MKWAALVRWLMVFTVVSAFAQRPSLTMGIQTLDRGGLLRGVIQGEAAERPVSPSGPKWFVSQAFTLDTGLEFPASVYDPSTKVMMTFGGTDWGAEAIGTNAVLLYAPANSTSANFTVLIPNGAPGSPPARNQHNAIYDAANNRMIVFAGANCQPNWFICTTFSLFNDVWVLSNANGQGGASSWTQLSPSGTPPAPRGNATAVYDSTNNLMIVFGAKPVAPFSPTSGC